jgi:hypothetical protein
MLGTGSPTVENIPVPPEEGPSLRIQRHYFADPSGHYADYGVIKHQPHTGIWILADDMIGKATTNQTRNGGFS